MTADHAGITRQSYAAIEAGDAVPSTEIALRLARAFGQPVEALFRLRESDPERVRARYVAPLDGDAPVEEGTRVRLATVGGERYAYGPGKGERALGIADGVVVGREGHEVEVILLPDGPVEAGLVVAGCDPAFGVVAETLRAERGVELIWRQRGSRAALEALARGESHVAGAHLRDPATGEYNAPWVERLIPFPCTRVGFAVWEQGLLVGAGNPFELRSVEDLARPGVRLLNREAGSGSRELLDARLRAAGIPGERIGGYDTRSAGHMAVAEAIASGVADAGVAIRAAGAAFGLDMIPLQSERYELIVPNHFLGLSAIQMLLETLRKPGIRLQVEALGGYDGAGMGEPC